MGQSHLNVFCHVHQGSQGRVNILILRGNVFVLNVDVSYEKIHLRQSIAQLARLTEVGNQSPVVAINRVFDSECGIASLLKFSYAGCLIDVSL